MCQKFPKGNFDCFEPSKAMCDDEIGIGLLDGVQGDKYSTEKTNKKNDC